MAATDYVFRGMRVPGDLLESIQLYVEHGIPQGDFLAAVIDNDLEDMDQCERVGSGVDLNAHLGRNGSE